MTFLLFSFSDCHLFVATCMEELNHKLIPDGLAGTCISQALTKPVSLISVLSMELTLDLSPGCCAAPLFGGLGQIWHI